MRSLADDDTRDLDPAPAQREPKPGTSAVTPAPGTSRPPQGLSDADRAAIAAAVARAESRTSAEIVPVVARASGRYDRAEDLFGLCFGLALVLLVAAFSPPPVDPSSWDSGWGIPLGLGGTLLLLVGGCFVGAALATFFPILCAPMISRAEKLACIRQRAADAFLDARVSGTARRDGLLIYVSLRERMVFVIADAALQGRIPSGALDPIARAAVAGFKARLPAKAMIDAVTTAGDLLSRIAPAQTGQANELANAPREM